MRASIILVPLLILVSACVPIGRQQECIDADKCDKALEDAFGDFDEKDPVFGDTGTCWLDAETAKPCQDICNQFVAEEKQDAIDAEDQTVIDACGGDDEDD